jgi:hypothetical protein
MVFIKFFIFFDFLQVLIRIWGMIIEIRVCDVIGRLWRLLWWFLEVEGGG